jgi:hypothetical protein
LLEAADSIGYLLTVIFGLEGRHRPYFGYLERELRVYPLNQPPLPNTVLLQSIERIVTTADLPIQQQLMRAVEPLCRSAGHGDVIDDWGKHYDWLTTFKPDWSAP